MLSERSNEQRPERKIWLICPTFPPRICGVGDHTKNLATVLGAYADVTVITARAAEVSQIPGLKIRQLFEPTRPNMVLELARAIAEGAPDWIFLQYDPYAWHFRYGFNPLVPLLFAELRRRAPRVRIAVMVHETFPEVTSAPRAALAGWVGAQIWTMGRLADTVIFPVESWARRFHRWFPRTRVTHLPVGSNLEVVPGTREEARARLGVSERAIVLGLFGRAGPTRTWDVVRRAVERLLESGLEPVVYYLGLEADAVRDTAMPPGARLIAEGPLPPAEISRRLRAMDIYLVPIAEGVSARRTSLMAGLAHGLATVSTSGEVTEAVLMRENGRGIFLSAHDDPEGFARHVLALARDERLRNAVAAAGLQFFAREFSWEKIRETVLAALPAHG